MFRLKGCGIASAIILALGSFGCSSEDSPSTEPEVVEVFSLWANGGEEEALNKLLEVHSQRRPNAEVIKSVEADFVKYNDRLDDRMSQRNPPDTFQSNQGMRLKRWVLFNNTDDAQSKLDPITDLAAEQGWSAAIPQEILDVNSFKGTLYGVPLSIIRQNTFYYNKQIMADNQIDPTTWQSVDDLLAACEKLKAAGIQPLGMGNINQWVLDMFLWENLFPSVVGADYYIDFWEGRKSPRDQQITDTLNKLLEVWKYVNTDNTDIDFPDAMRRLDTTAGSDPVAMEQMGDWGTGMLISYGLDPDGDFGVIPFPGMKDIFMFSADVFPLSKGITHRAATRELLTTIASKEAQEAFNKIKGSLPARLDVSLDGYSTPQIDTFNQFNSARRVPVVHGLKPDSIMPDLAAKAAEMVQTGDIAVVQNYLDANYQALAALPR